VLQDAPLDKVPEALPAESGAVVPLVSLNVHWFTGEGNGDAIGAAEGVLEGNGVDEVMGNGFSGPMGWGRGRVFAVGSGVLAGAACKEMGEENVVV
jgi:hypothetical protein